MTHNFDAQKVNDDLLVLEEDLERGRRNYPSIFHILDHPALRDVFTEYDRLANAAKKRSRRAGVAAVLLAAVALLGASAEPLYHGLSAPYPELIGSASAVAGVMGVVIGLWGVLYRRSKREWLYRRLMTERLRQFHFQTFVCRLPEIAASLKGDGADYQERREKWFEVFKGRYIDKLGAEFTSMLDDHGADIWIHETKPASDATALQGAPDEAIRDLFGAYRSLRIMHQLQYAKYKLRAEGNRLSAPARQQESVLANTSLLCILGLFTIHLFVAFVGAIGAPIGNDWIHVVVIWLAIFALAARALEEGLQPSRELERYRHYRSSVQVILDQFDSATSADDKIRIMEQTERLSFEEMRNFLRTSNEARFIM